MTAPELPPRPGTSMDKRGPTSASTTQNLGGHRPASASATTTIRRKSVRMADESPRAYTAGSGFQDAPHPLALQHFPGGSRPASGGPRRPQGPPPSSLDPRRQGNFARALEQTIEKLRGDRQEQQHEELGRTLASIRKQFDEVRFQANARAAELQDVRNTIRRLEAEAEAHPEYGVSARAQREQTLERLEQVAVEIDQEQETQKVYQHLLARTGRELRLVKEKVTAMETHVQRKEWEVKRTQDASLRLHTDKVEALQELEYLEQEVDTERRVCTSALQDLQEGMHEREMYVEQRQNFEAWRYQVAKQAASDAFQATAGRFRKIYALEKLTGNCLQKTNMEQLEANQKTEDNFQKIKEVTGLQNVMDIVHKFLTKDAEAEQLQRQVHEAEQRLERLRKDEAERHSEGVSFDLYDDISRGATKGTSVPIGGLNAEVAQREQELATALHQHEELQRRLRRNTLQLEGVLRWAQRTHPSFRLAGSKHGEAETLLDLPEYFEGIAHTVEAFLSRALDQYGANILAKRAQASLAKEFRDQEYLLEDKDFQSRNCRVQPSVEHPALADDAPTPGRRGKEAENAGEETDLLGERNRLKKEARSMVNAKLADRWKERGGHLGGGGGRRRADREAWDWGEPEESEAATQKAARAHGHDAGGEGGHVHTSEGAASAKRVGPSGITRGPTMPALKSSARSHR